MSSVSKVGSSPSPQAVSPRESFSFFARIAKIARNCLFLFFDQAPPSGQAASAAKITLTLDQKREYPPLSLNDTCIGFGNGVVSAHGESEVFSDNEILEIKPIIRRVLLENHLEVSFTEYNKPIIQQQAIRGCTAAAAAMLILDREGRIEYSWLSMSNLGNDSTMISALVKAGFIASLIEIKDLSALRERIALFGSVIVSCEFEDGGHVLVVDDVSEDLSRVRIRDPYHGWEITVKAESFLKVWIGSSKSIQITREVPGGALKQSSYDGWVTFDS